MSVIFHTLFTFREDPSGTYFINLVDAVMDLTDKTEVPCRKLRQFLIIPSFAKTFMNNSRGVVSADATFLTGLLLIIFLAETHVNYGHIISGRLKGVLYNVVCRDANNENFTVAYCYCESETVEGWELVLQEIIKEFHPDLIITDR